MNTTDKMEPFNQLDKIQKVDAPEYMLTRIYAKIDNLASKKVKPVFAWSTIGAFSLVVVINVFVLINNQNQEQQTNTILNEMGMEINNSIY
jgi:hypothetical protein